MFAIQNFFGCLILSILFLLGTQKIFSQNLQSHKIIITQNEFIIEKAKSFINSRDSGLTIIEIYQNGKTIGRFIGDNTFIVEHFINETDFVVFFKELDSDFIAVMNKLGGLPTSLYEVILNKPDSSVGTATSKKYIKQHQNKQAIIKTQKNKNASYNYQLDAKEIDTATLQYFVTIKPFPAKKTSNTYKYCLHDKNTVDLSRFHQDTNIKNKLYTAKIEAWYNGFLICESKPIKFKAKKNRKKFDTKIDTNLFIHPINIYDENPLISFADPIHNERKILDETKNLLGNSSVPSPSLNITDIISAEGNFSVQSYYSNNKFHGQYQPNQYARFIANPTVSVLGLPFKVNLFLSTENSPFNPVNSFSIGFDADKFRTNIEDRATKKEELRRQIGAIRYQKLSTELKNIENHKKRLAVLSKEDSLLSQQADNYVSKKYNVPNVSIDSLKDFNSPGFQKDTALNFTVNDSLINVNSNYQLDYNRLKNDSTYLILKQGIDKRKRETDSLNKVIKEIEKAVTVFTKLYQNPSSYLTETIQNNADEGIDTSMSNKKKLASSSLRNKKPIINAIKKFNVGLFNPFISSLTLAGIPVKGLELELEFDRTFYRIMQGNTINTQNFILNTNIPQTFNRNISSVLVGLGKAQQNNLYFSILYFNDKNRIVTYDTSSDLSYPKENLIYSVGGKTKLTKKSTFTSELNYSHYTENKFLYNQNAEKTPFRIEGFNQSQNYKSNLSFNNNFEYNILTNTTIKLNVKYIGPGYHSLGVPFLRTDYHEEEFKLNQSAFDKKLQIDLSYKENRDNLFNLKSHTTVMRGTGVTAKTNFTKYPNILISYIPFSVNSTLTNLQNNNLPVYSTVQQISNTTNITIVNAYYFLAHKKTTYNINIAYTKNQTTTTSISAFSVETYNGNLIVSLPNRTILSFFGSSSSYSPASDSLSSFTNLSGSYSTGIFKKAKLIVGMDYVENKNYRSSIGYRASIQLNVKKIVFSFQTGYRKLQGNWGVYHTNDFFMQTTITFKL